MGGKALSANVAIRLTKANYERLASECVAKLRAAYPGMRIEVLGNYLDKADFGDCDILIESSDAYDPHQAAGVLEAVEVVRNGPVTSIGDIVRPEAPFRDGNVFQVDLIRMPLEAFDFALAYFGRGDAVTARAEEQAEYGGKKCNGDVWMPGTSANAGLTAARTNKNDEYYTQLPDIEVKLRPNHIVKQYDLNKELGNGLR